MPGKKSFVKRKTGNYPPPIEHSYPDYSLYGITDTAYGFMSRGCPRGCDFCHVAAKEGKRSRKVADLKEFWRNQRNIVLLDPNTLACAEWKDILTQLIESKAKVDFNQGLDIRLMSEEKAEMLSQISIKAIRFAWDRFEDKESILPKFEIFRQKSNVSEHNLQVYVLCGFNTTIEQDLERIYTLRDMGYKPYVMLYDKEHIPNWHDLRRMQRWVNSSYIFYSCDRFEDYK